MLRGKPSVENAEKLLAASGLSEKAKSTIRQSFPPKLGPAKLRAPSEHDINANGWNQVTHLFWCGAGQLAFTFIHAWTATGGPFSHVWFLDWSNPWQPYNTGIPAGDYFYLSNTAPPSGAQSITYDITASPGAWIEIWSHGCYF